MKYINTLLSTNNSSAQLIARLTLALVIFPHGAQKLLGWFGGYGFEGTMGFFTGTLGIPAIFAFAAIAVEFFSPILLALGIFSRLNALLIGFTMFVAMMMATASNGFFMNWMGNQAGEGIEYHLLTLGLALLITISGGGRWGLDQVLEQKIAKV
ncbi:DoxX family protein [Puniceicoccaceae bacterium K14]|nr:DoxX family protein [Puniceicoccaceae bacterium K14]